MESTSDLYGINFDLILSAPKLSKVSVFKSNLFMNYDTLKYAPQFVFGRIKQRCKIQTSTG